MKIDDKIIEQMRQSYTDNLGRAVTERWRAAAAVLQKLHEEELERALSSVTDAEAKWGFTCGEVNGLLANRRRALIAPEPTLREKIVDVLKQYPDRAPEIADKILDLLERK